MTYTNCCTYGVSPADDEQQACSKHVEDYYLNKLIESIAYCWFTLYGHITMHDQQNVKFAAHLFAISAGRLKVACASYHYKFVKL
jgi:hypothetical protein